MIDVSTNLIEIARDAIIGIDENGIVYTWNKEAEKIFGYSKSEMIGQQITTIIPERYRKQHNDGLSHFIMTGKPRIIDSIVEVYGKTRNGAEVPIEMSLSSQKNEDGKYIFIAIIRDLTKRKKHEIRLRVQYAVIHALSESTTVKMAFEKTLRVICETLDWDFGVVWIYHQPENVLRCEESWNVPAIEAFEFTKKTKEISFSPGIGLPGRVLASTKPDWINDVAEATNFPRATSALEAGLHGAFCFPIIINKEVLGVVEFFSLKPQEVDNDLLDMVSAIGNQIGLYIKRNHAEKLLIESEKKHRKFIEAAHDAFVGIDENGIINIWNTAAEKIFRYKNNEIIGKSINAILTYESRNMISLSSKDKKIGKILQLSGKTKKGILIPIEMSITSNNESNEKLSFAIIIRDLTEEKLWESEILKLSRAVEQSPCTIIITDYEGKIEYVNPKFTRLSGYTLKDCLGKNPRILKSENTKSEKYKELWETIKSGREWQGEFYNKKKNNEYYWESASISSLKNSEGVITHFVAVKEDITERKEMEQQLLRSQKLESIGHLAAGIAHEINTPTQYITDNTSFLKNAFSDINILLKKYSQLYEMGKSGSVTSELIAEIGVIVENADIDYLVEEIPNAINQSLEGLDRVKKIVYAMKNFSHPDNEDKKLVDINESIKNTINVARNEWKYIAEIKTDFDSSLTPVLCFPGDFNQVILNLIVNAAHAIDGVSDNGSEAKGTISISTSCDGDWAEIRVSDTGTGIPEHIRSMIFNPFFTTKEVGKGTGQGLPLVHSIVVGKHNGTITLDTELGKGTTFIIRLPLCSSFSEILTAETV